MRDESKVISLRVDSEIFNKISKLETARKESKSAVIKGAIEESFNKLIVSYIHRKIFEISKELFTKIKIEGVFYSENYDDGKDEEDPFNEDMQTSRFFRSIAKYKLSYPEYEDANKNSFNLNDFEISLECIGPESLRIKIYFSNIVSGNSSKINSNLLMKIMQIASDGGVQTETDSTRKGLLSLNIFFEREASFDVNKWYQRCKNDMKNIKTVVEKIVNILENEKLNKK